MKVVKRSGEVQPLTVDKISLSVSRASDDAKQPLNVGDIEMLTNGVLKRINNTGKDTLKSFEIFEFVILELENNGFESIAKEYRHGRRA